MAQYVKLDDHFNSPLDPAIWDYTKDASVSSGKLVLTASGAVYDYAYASPNVSRNFTGSSIAFETQFSLDGARIIGAGPNGDSLAAFRVALQGWDEDSGSYWAGIEMWTAAGSASNTEYAVRTFTSDPVNGWQTGVALTNQPLNTQMWVRIGVDGPTGNVWMERSSNGTSYAPIREIFGNFFGSVPILFTHVEYARYNEVGPPANAYLEYYKISTSEEDKVLSVDNSTVGVLSDNIGLHAIPVPTSTPLVGYSGGLGSGGFGRGYGAALLPGIKNYDVELSDAAFTLAAAAISVNQRHNLSAANASTSLVAQTAAISQVHNVLAAGSTFGVTAESPVPVFSILLGINSADIAVSSSEPLLVNEFTIPVHNSTIGLTSLTVPLSQAQSILVDSGLLNVGSDIPLVVENKTLAVDSALHNLHASIASIIQQHSLMIDDAAHSLSATEAELLQRAILGVQAGRFDVSAPQLDIIHFTLLRKPDDVYIAIGSEVFPLSQAQNLDIADAHHSLSATTLEKIINWDELNVYFGVYPRGSATAAGLQEAEQPGGGVLSRSTSSKTFLDEADVIASGVLVKSTPPKGKL